jgi:hypothetical protein
MHAGFPLKNGVHAALIGAITGGINGQGNEGASLARRGQLIREASESIKERLAIYEG